MAISKTIKTLSEKNIIISLNNKWSGFDGLAINLNNIFLLKISQIEKSLELVLDTVHEVDDDLLMAAKGVLFQLIQLLKTLDSSSLMEISFRELENMLRDQNATRSFDQRHSEVVESLARELKLFIVKFEAVLHYLESDLKPQVNLEVGNFFDDLKRFHQIRLDMKPLFQVSENELPRLNTWDKKSGELSFIIDHQTGLSSLDNEFFRIIWLEVEGVKQIKMVTSEGS